MEQEDTKRLINCERAFRTFEEIFCFILFGCGVYMIVFFINIESIYDPTTMQNLLILIFGCFVSYVFLMNQFWNPE